MPRKYAELQAKMSPERQANARARAEEILKGMPLHELRRARSLTQTTLAQTMDTTQGEISKIEQRTDVYVSTLRNYVEAMGGELEIVARFGDGAVKITQFSDLAPATK